MQCNSFYSSFLSERIIQFYFHSVGYWCLIEYFIDKIHKVLEIRDVAQAEFEFHIPDLNISPISP